MIKISALFFSFLMIFSPSVSAKSEMIVQKVIDGETIELSDGRRIHLIGIKTSHVQPILTDRFKLSLDKIASLDLSQLGQGAATYIENHAVGKTVVLSFDPANEKRNHRDPEGRTLAYVWRISHMRSSEESEGAEKIFGIKAQTRLLNQELVMMGHALVDTSAPFLQQEDFLNTEKSAAKSTVGFWRSASEVYGDLLSQAQGAQSVSTAGFVSKDSQKTSLESSRKNFTELINLNPKDYRSYYERSWLGANPIHNKISEINLQDADKALELSILNPKCYMQKSYLLALNENYDEASQVYTKMTRVAGKMGMVSLVTEMSMEKLETPEWSEMNKMPEWRPFMLDALRATFNEDHFLFFMARYQNYKEKVPEFAAKGYEKVSSLGRFPGFLKKNEVLLSQGSSRDILFRTQWALRGHEMPEDVMRWMETIGEATLANSSDDDKNVIDMTGREEEGKEKKKKKGEAAQSETQFLS